MTNPEPVSPLPWMASTFFRSDDPSHTAFPCIIDNENNTIVDFDCCDDWDFEDAGYIVWAANNAPAMAARIERLEAALQAVLDFGRGDAFEREAALKIARKALEQ